MAFLVQVDDGRARRLALLVLDRVTRAAEELAEAAAALDHLAPAVRALVLTHLPQRGLALLVDRLRVAALAVLAREEEAVLADAVQHRRAALLTRVRRFRA